MTSFPHYVVLDSQPRLGLTQSEFLNLFNFLIECRIFMKLFANCSAFASLSYQEHVKVFKPIPLISPRLLREGANQLCTPLSKFFNRLIISGQYPQAWKYANVKPVYEKGDKQLPNNYRPISLLSVIGKTMERSVHNYVYNYCTQHKVFTPFQSGFVQGDSATYQLINLYDTFFESVDNGKEVRVVFYIFQKRLTEFGIGAYCTNYILSAFRVTC